MITSIVMAALLVTHTFEGTIDVLGEMPNTVHEIIPIGTPVTATFTYDTAINNFETIAGHTFRRHYPDTLQSASIMFGEDIEFFYVPNVSRGVVEVLTEIVGPTSIPGRTFTLGVVSPGGPQLVAPDSSVWDIHSFQVDIKSFFPVTDDASLPESADAYQDADFGGLHFGSKMSAAFSNEDLNITRVITAAVVVPIPGLLPLFIIMAATAMGGRSFKRAYLK